MKPDRRLARQKRPATRAREATRVHRIDASDRQILAMLQDNARSPNNEIGQRIAMVPSDVFDRIRRLERAGVIQGYEARVDPVALGLPLVAFVFVRSAEPKGRTNATPRRLVHMPEVHEIHHIAGEDCYLVKVRTSGTVALGHLLRRISAIPTVQSTRTTIVLGTDKETRRLNIISTEE